MLYKGFDTSGFLKRRSFILTDAALITRDLLNHIYTMYGEMPHNSNFGSTIPRKAFAALDDQLINDVTSQITEVVNYDPRVKLQDIAVIPVEEQNALLVVLDIYYTQLNFADTIRLNLQG